MSDPSEIYKKVYAAEVIGKIADMHASNWLTQAWLHGPDSPEATKAKAEFDDARERYEKAKTEPAD